MDCIICSLLRTVYAGSRQSAELGHNTTEKKPQLANNTDLDPQRDGLQLRSHLIEFADIPPRPDQVFGLDLACAYLSILRTLSDIRDELLLLVFELDSFAVEFTLCLF